MQCHRAVRQLSLGDTQLLRKDAPEQWSWSGEAVARAQVEEKSMSRQLRRDQQCRTSTGAGPALERKGEVVGKQRAPEKRTAPVSATEVRLTYLAIGHNAAILKERV